MAQYVPSDSLVAAVLSDVVYHTAGETINTANLGWVPVLVPSANGSMVPLVSYDSSTGYYAEAWGKPVLDSNGNPIAGQYSEIMQINRGTVISQPGANSTAPELDLTPNTNLSKNYSRDSNDTILTDIQIVASDSLFGLTPTIIPNYISASATTFFSTITRYFPGVPIIETGQSLGGATADGVFAKEYANGDTNISAITFNALPFTASMATELGITQSELSTIDDPNATLVRNYYVGNEIATTQTLFEGTAIGDSIELPPLQVDGPAILSAGTIHSTTAAIAELLQSSPPSTYQNDKTWLAEAYPAPDKEAQPILDVLSGATLNSDPGATGITLNLNNTISLTEKNSSGQTQDVVTLSPAELSQATNLVVTALPASNFSAAAQAWETDAYHGSTLVGITQSIVYKDGSFGLYYYTPQRVLQSIYSAAYGGDTVVQTFSATGDLRNVVTLTPTDVLQVKQYQGDPSLVSDSTINIGGATIAGITENAEINRRWWSSTMGEPAASRQTLGSILIPTDRSMWSTGRGKAEPLGPWKASLPAGFPTTPSRSIPDPPARRP